MGGPVWHASAQSMKSRWASRQVARDALRGVGDPALGEWEEDGMKRGVVHVKRRLSEIEREQFGVPEPFDARGTDVERERLNVIALEQLDAVLG